jgi:hypothetical protein
MQPSMQTSRLEDMHADRQAGRQTANTQTGRQAWKQAGCRYAYRQTGRQAYKPWHRQTGPRNQQARRPY